MTASLNKASNRYFYFYGLRVSSLGWGSLAQTNKKAFIVTSLAQSTNSHSYAFRDPSVKRCLAIDNLDTYLDATERL